MPSRLSPEFSTLLSTSLSGRPCTHVVVFFFTVIFSNIVACIKTGVPLAAKWQSLQRLSGASHTDEKQIKLSCGPDPKPVMVRQNGTLQVLGCESLAQAEASLHAAVPSSTNMLACWHCVPGSCFLC